MSAVLTDPLDLLDNLLGRAPVEFPWEEPIPLTEGDRPAFPTEHLPQVLRQFVEGVSVMTQTTPALAAMLSIAVIASAAAKRVAVQVRPRWVEPVNVFVLLTLPPANRKSAVYAEVVRPLEEVEAEESERVAAQIALADNERKIKEKQLERIQSEAAKAKTNDDAMALLSDANDLTRELHELPSLTLPRLLVDDVSPEKLANLLSEQGGRIGVFSPEGGLFETIAGKYNQNGAPSLDVFLKGHSGDTLRVDRIHRPPDFVSHPALTVGLTVQPDVQQGLADKPGFRGRGLLARFWYGILESSVGRRHVTAPVVSDTVVSDYNRLVRNVLAITPSTDTDGRVRPHLLRMDDEAAQTFLAFETALEPRLGDEGDLAHIADWAGKLAGGVARLSGILHVARIATEGGTWSTPIPARTVHSAIAIAEKFLTPHALVAFSEMGANPAIQDARHILRWLERSPKSSLTKRDIHQQFKRRFQRSYDLDPALTVLVERGYLQELPAPDRDHARGRKPSPVFEINPILRPHNSPYPHNKGLNGHCEDVEDFEDRGRLLADCYEEGTV